jgi:hypothetical protein
MQGFYATTLVARVYKQAYFAHWVRRLVTSPSSACRVVCAKSLTTIHYSTIGACWGNMFESHVKHIFAFFLHII